MDKTSEKVTKDRKGQERGKKSHEAYIKRLKQKMPEDNQLLTPSPTDKATPSTSSSTPPTSSSTGDSTPSTTTMPSTTLSHTARPNDTYVYGVGIVAVLAIGVCVFFGYNGFPKNNKKVNEEKQDQLPKRHLML